MSRNNKSSNVGLGNNALEKGMNGEDGAKKPPDGFVPGGWKVFVVTAVALTSRLIQHPFPSLSNFPVLKLAQLGGSNHREEGSVSN